MADNKPTPPTRGPGEPRPSGKSEEPAAGGKPTPGAASEREAAASRTTGVPARSGQSASGSQPSRDQSKVGDDGPPDARSEETRARHQLIREQTRPLTPEEVRPRETAQNRKPEDRATRPGHDVRMRGDVRGGIRVQALKDLFHENRRIRAGEVFTLRDVRKFKATQMVEVTNERPARRPADVAAKGFPFAEAAQVRRGIPGMPRDRQRSATVLEEGMVPGAVDARDGLTPEQRKDHDFGNAPVTNVDPDALPDPDQRPALSPNEARARDDADGLLE